MKYIREQSIHTCMGIRSPKFRVVITSGGATGTGDQGPDFNIIVRAAY